MTVSHEPGDGSFEVIIEEREPVPQDWVTCKAAVILRRTPFGFTVVKARGGTVG